MFENRFEVQNKEDTQEPQEQSIFQRIGNDLIDIVKETNEVSKEIIDVIAQNRNFEIKFEEDQGQVKLRLIDKNTFKEKDLTQYLPPGTSFVESGDFFYDLTTRQVAFPKDKIKFRGFLLSLFHEIGHAHQKIENLKSIIEILKREITQKESSQEYSKDISSLSDEYFLPQEYLDKLFKEKIESERNAWAFALSTLKKLQKEGFDVFSEFTSAKQIKDFIAFHLSTYDILLQLSKFFSGDIVGLVDTIFKQPFSKQLKSGKGYLKSLKEQP